MREDTYRVERFLTILTFVMFGVIIFSTLVFFEVIRFSSGNQETCILPRGFTCESVSVQGNVLTLETTYRGGTLFQLEVQPQRCDSYSGEFIDSGRLTMHFSCSFTRVGEMQDIAIEFNFLQQGRPGMRKESGRIRTLIS